MKLETFFEKFDQFADAPDAVAKMRELVLQLAVQGTVVDPVDDDEPVEKFLRGIWADKSGSRTELLNVEKAQPFELPAHWRWVVLAEVAEFSIGKTPPRGDSSYWYPEDHSWVSIADMKNYGTITETKEKVSASAAQEVFRQRFAEPGSILMSFKLTIGKVARAGIRCFHNEAIISLQPPEPELSDYLFRFLPIFAKLQTSNNAIKGSTLNKGLLTLLPIALPPLAEQKRIVAKVDELMALCDRLEAQQQERETRHAALARASLARFADAPTPANLPFLFHPSYAIPPADLRKSILTLAVQGKLVPQDPTDEQAEDSLARNDERRRETSRSDHRADEENQPLLSADDRWDIADTWSWRGLADLVLFVDYRGKTPAKLSSGVRLLTAKNVRKGQINLSPEEFLSESEYHAWMTRGFPKAGDVLFTTEAPMGNAAVVELTERFALAQRVICFQSYGALDPAFLVLQILSDQFQFILDKNGTGVTAKGIKASKLKQLPIAIPPLAEQRRIVAKVEQLMALVDALETQLAASRATAANLLSALVAELTVGEGPFSHRPVRPPPARPGLPGVVK
jgi:type I restriction enzyme S subunit